MAITPGPGYMVDPNNPNGVIPIGSTASSKQIAPTGQPNQIAPPVAPTNTAITRTSSAPAPAPTPAPAPQPSYTPVQGTSNTVTPTPTASVNNYGLTPTSANWLQLQQGETVDNYNKRIAAANPNLPAPGTTSSTGISNNAGGLASSLINPNITSTSPALTSGTAAGGATGAPKTFSDIVGTQVSSALTGSGVAGAAGTGLLNSGTSNPLTSSPAYQQYLTDNANLQSVRDQLATAKGGLESSDATLPFVTGREASLNTMASQKEGNLQQAIANDIALTGQSISEQGQQQAGLTSAGNIGNTAQGLLQSGLASAASSAQPSGAFPWSYNPLTGQFSNASTTGASVASGFSGNYGTDTATMAKAIMGNQIGYSDAESALSNYYGATADANLQAAILAAGGNPTVLKAQAAALSQNTTAVGTAPVQANLGIYNQQLANLASSQVAAQQIGSFGDQLIATMSAPPEQGGLGINPYSSQYANMTLNAIKSQFSDPKYATFNTNIQGLQARISSLLQTGEIPTAATAGAQSIASGNATLASMQATLQQVQAEAGAITGAQANVASTAFQNAQTAAGGQTGTSAGNATAQTSLGTFVLKNGQWVPSQ